MGTEAFTTLARLGLYLVLVTGVALSLVPFEFEIAPSCGGETCCCFPDGGDPLDAPDTGAQVRDACGCDDPQPASDTQSVPVPLTFPTIVITTVPPRSTPAPTRAETWPAGDVPTPEPPPPKR